MRSMHHAILITHQKSVWAKDKKGKREKLRGCSEFRKSHAEVKMSLSENETALEWLQTYIHEQIHVGLYRFLPELFDFKRPTEKSEHKFIEAIEKAISKKLHLLKPAK